MDGLHAWCFPRLRGPFPRAVLRGDRGSPPNEGASRSVRDNFEGAFPQALVWQPARSSGRWVPLSRDGFRAGPAFAGYVGEERLHRTRDVCVRTHAFDLLEGSPAGGPASSSTPDGRKSRYHRSRSNMPMPEVGWQLWISLSNNLFPSIPLVAGDGKAMPHVVEPLSVAVVGGGVVSGRTHADVSTGDLGEVCSGRPPVTRSPPPFGEEEAASGSSADDPVPSRGA